MDYNLRIGLVPDIILSDQWCPKVPLSPERKLCWAILREALDCLQLGGVCNGHARDYDRSVNRKRLAAEARDWLKCDDDRVHSFVFICAALDLEPDWLRKKLREGNYL